MITADHQVLDEEQLCRLHHRYAAVVQDLATQWIENYPCKSISAQEAQRSLRAFLRPEENPRSIFPDKFLELVKACEELSWNGESSTPHRSETNEIAERGVRRVKAGASSVFAQSGLQESCWAEAMECCCSLGNVQDRQTPCERRFNSPLEGTIIP